MEETRPCQWPGSLSIAPRLALRVQSKPIPTPAGPLVDVEGDHRPESCIHHLHRLTLGVFSVFSLCFLDFSAVNCATFTMRKGQSAYYFIEGRNAERRTSRLGLGQMHLAAEPSGGGWPGPSRATGPPCHTSPAGVWWPRAVGSDGDGPAVKSDSGWPGVWAPLPLTAVVGGCLGSSPYSTVWMGREGMISPAVVLSLKSLFKIDDGTGPHGQVRPQSLPWKGPEEAQGQLQSCPSHSAQPQGVNSGAASFRKPTTLPLLQFPHPRCSLSPLPS